METGNTNQAEEKPTEKWVLTTEEKKRLVDFFSILVEVDRRNKRKINETQSN